MATNNIHQQFLPEAGFNIYSYDLDVEELTAEQALDYNLLAHDKLMELNAPLYADYHRTRDVITSLTVELSSGTVSMDVFDCLADKLNILSVEFYPHMTEKEILNMLEQQHLLNS